MCDCWLLFRALISKIIRNFQLLLVLHFILAFLLVLQPYLFTSELVNTRVYSFLSLIPRFM
ncbi:unnamed protein product [Meloidogyne enterolobii]|uniref:Uncharacterized protein n=1 Tax=Meloidogyne enterolobii TaxID=390850 RepID=A0ACB0YHU2_MELEN